MSKIEMELEEYDRIVSALYDAALDSSRWAEALEMFRDLFQANFVTLILRSPDESNLGMMIAVGLEGGDRVTYLPYGHTATPFVNQLPDTVFTVDDLMT
ncbi:MAG: helix-turn-helix transcriptional regulator, partial [Zoogloea sp.]|nr:helix-turn-helix transcriptional regulator [Zoogloea sp.]